MCVCVFVCVVSWLFSRESMNPFPLVLTFLLLSRFLLSFQFCFLVYFPSFLLSSFFLFSLIISSAAFLSILSYVFPLLLLLLLPLLSDVTLPSLPSCLLT